MFYFIQNINVSYIFKSIENACQKFKRVFSISSLMMSFNLIQYRETMGMFTNCCFATNSFNYSYFSKKYHNYDTFKLPIRVIIVIKSMFSETSLVGICDFSRTILYLSFMCLVFVFSTFGSVSVLTS